ncbi:MAG TPA: hypothetical protein VKT31_00645 [Solirubrobacteraceae bacterium]|nr:hypothetical protein [Solirubrobacteraceae bacterium]
MRRVLFSLALLFAFSVIAPSNALADGCGSAGNSQYFDPLQSCNTQPPPPTHTSSTPPPVTTYPTVTQPTVTVAASSDPGSKSLPFTGLNLVPVIVIAVALVGGGLVLRRLAAHDG